MGREIRCKASVDKGSATRGASRGTHRCDDGSSKDCKGVQDGLGTVPIATGISQDQGGIRDGKRKFHDSIKDHVHSKRENGSDSDSVQGLVQRILVRKRSENAYGRCELNIT